MKYDKGERRTTAELIAELKNRFDMKDLLEVVRFDFSKIDIDEESLREIVENTSTMVDLRTELEGLKNKKYEPSEAELKEIKDKAKKDAVAELDAKYAKKFDQEKEKLRKEFEKALEKDKEKFRKEFEGKQPKTQESAPEPAQPAPKAPEPQPAPAPAPVNKPEINVWTNPDGTKITVSAVIKNLKGEFIEIPEEHLKVLKQYEYVPEEVKPHYLACSITPEGEKFIGSYSDYLKSLKEQK